MFYLAMLSVSLTIAQQASAEGDDVSYPIVPLIVDYEYAPEHFLQWVNDNPHYSMIQASVSKNDPPVYRIILFEKGSGQPVYYCNSESQVKQLLRAGKEAHLSKIDFRAVKHVGQEPMYGFGFSDKHDRAIRWRFIPAGEPSERGAGLSPQNGGKGLLILYRGLSTAAGEGTAVQIGDKVSEAEPWPEISAPPYFVAYRGAYVRGMGVGSLLTGSESWRVESAPKNISEGAEWILTDSRGNKRQLRVTSARGDDLTISEKASQTSSAAVLTIDARKMEKGIAIRSITVARGDHFMRISFSPSLGLSMKKSESVFQIDQNGQEKLVHGKVFAERREGEIDLRLQPESPSWAKSRALNATIKPNVGGYKIDVHQ